MNVFLSEKYTESHCVVIAKKKNECNEDDNNNLILNIIGLPEAKQFKKYAISL